MLSQHIQKLSFFAAIKFVFKIYYIFKPNLFIRRDAQTCAVTHAVPDVHLSKNQTASAVIGLLEPLPPYVLEFCVRL